MLHLQKQLLINTGKYQPREYFQNIGLYLVTYFQNIIG